MSENAEPQPFAAIVRRDVVWRSSVGYGGFLLLLPCLIVIVTAKNGGDQGPVWVVCAVLVGLAALTAWLTGRRLLGSALYIDADGIEVRTRATASRLRWTDLDSVTFAAVDNGNLLLATVRPGVTLPSSTPLAYPYWSPQRHCVIVINVKLLVTSQHDVTAALQHHGGSVFQASRPAAG